MTKLILVGMVQLLAIGTSYSQNIGIGTNTPIEKFTIFTPLNRWGLLHTDGTIQIGSFTNQFFGGYLGTKSNHSLNLVTNGSPGLTLHTTGNLSVGTLFSDARLHVSNSLGSTDLVLGRRFLNDGSTSLKLGTSALTNGYAFIQSGPAAAANTYSDLVINEVGGRVGIGTNSPGAKLEVAGSIMVSGRITRPDGIIYSMIPICVGVALASGGLRGHSGGVIASTHTSVGVYSFHKDGVLPNSVAIVTSNGRNDVVFKVNCGSGAFTVEFFTTSGVPVDTEFSFVVYGSS